MGLAPKAERRVGRVVHAVAKIWALCGGLVLFAMAGVTVSSVLGRSLAGFGLRPITGDFELVEMGCAVAVFAFLPWCQFNRSHVSVDILVQTFSPRFFAALGCVGDIALSLCSGLILWRMWLGFIEKFPHGSPEFRDTFGLGAAPFFPETSYELQISVWIPFGLAIIGATVFFVVSLYTIWRSLNWVIEGSEPASEGVS